MAVTFSNHGGLNDENWKVIDTVLSSVMQDTDTEKSKDDELVKQLFAVKTSKKFGEKKGSMTEFGNFNIVEEGDQAIQDDLQMGFSKLVEHEQMLKGFSCTRQAKDDGEIDIMKTAAANFVRSYKRTRAQFASDALCCEGSTFSFGGKTLDRTTGDGKGLFATDHPFKKVSGTQSNVFTNAFGSDATMLNRLANIGRNFKNGSGIPMGYTFDTIIIPSNCYALEDTVKKIIRTDLMVGSNLNDTNTQKGLWKLIVDPFWQAEAGEAPYILMSSAANKETLGNLFFDRIPLTMKDDVDINTHNYIWSGRARFSAGFANWSHVILGGAKTGTTLQ